MIALHSARSPVTVSGNSGSTRVAVGDQGDGIFVGDGSCGEGQADGCDCCGILHGE